MSEKRLQGVKAYFDGHAQRYGATPRGSDWNSQEAQDIRFNQLLKVVTAAGRFSILDFGCGYGALAAYLQQNRLDAEYHGFDISEAAIGLARDVHADKDWCRFHDRHEDLTVCDYSIASGIFNMRGDEPDDSWTDYVTDTLSRIDSLSRRGFAANFLTKYSDADRMQDYLYYADPLYLFDYCKRHFSRNVALLHDYALYDFTLIVRKT